jgi:hypothetical protein
MIISPDTAADRLASWIIYELAQGGYTWDRSVSRYRDKETGRLVSESKVLSTIERFNDTTIRDNIGGITDRFLDGRIDLPTWQQQMAREIKDGWIVNAMAGRGGKNSMEFSDYGRLGGRLRFEYDRLNQFALRIANGEMTAAQIRANALLYAAGPRVGYFDGKTAANRDAGFVAEQRFLRPGESCADCINYAGRGRVPIGSLPEPGEGSVCQRGCNCDKLYFKSFDESEN